jgi:hypothetical protein
MAMEMFAEALKFKHQTRSKDQAPAAVRQRVSFRAMAHVRPSAFGAWRLVFFWGLELGVWSFGFVRPWQNCEQPFLFQFLRYVHLHVTPL